MPMDTFNPPCTPDEGMDVQVRPRVVETKFGDGYSQEIPDGINSDLDALRPKWTNARYWEAQPILDFLRPKAVSREPFWWTPNGESAPRSLKCIRFTYAWKKGRFCDIQADFEETAARA